MQVGHVTCVGYQNVDGTDGGLDCLESGVECALFCDVCDVSVDFGVGVVF